MASRLPSPFSCDERISRRQQSSSSGAGVAGFVFISQPKYNNFNRPQGNFLTQQRMRGHQARGMSREGPGPIRPGVQYRSQQPFDNSANNSRGSHHNNYNNTPSPRQCNPYNIMGSGNKFNNTRGRGNNNSATYNNKSPGGWSPANSPSMQSANSSFNNSSNSSFNNSYNSSFNNSFNSSFNNSPFNNSLSSQRGRGRGGRRGGGHNTPLSDIPVEKFMSRAFFSDPWTSILNTFNKQQKEALQIQDQDATDGSDQNSTDKMESVTETTEELDLQDSHEENDGSFVDAWQ